MAFFKLCSDDPFISELRDIFKANALRTPEERIGPFTILSSLNKTVRTLGEIGSLLEGPRFQVPADAVKESSMANLSNRRSSAVDGKVGVQILSGLLAGMSDAADPDLSVRLKEARTLRFHFPNVIRRYVDIGRIGHLLSGRRFDPENLLFKTIVDQNVVIRLVDSVITSTDLEIDTGDESVAQLNIDVTQLQSTMTGGKLTVTASGDRSLCFRSSRRLTFAFTCVNVGVTETGVIRAVSPTADKVAPPQLVDMRDQDCGLDAHVLLTRAPTLIEFD